MPRVFIWISTIISICCSTGHALNVPVKVSIRESRVGVWDQKFPGDRAISTSFKKSLEEVETDKRNQNLEKQDIPGYVSQIRCRNLAGIVSSKGEDLVLDLEHGSSVSNFVAVTGETGHGKSILVSKIADLVTGGKATTAMLPKQVDGSNVEIEMTLKLQDEKQVLAITRSLENMKLKASKIWGSSRCKLPATLRLKRVLSVSQSNRLKSSCFLNGHSVPLKVLRCIGSPLLAVVNAAAASSALGDPLSRMALIDAGIHSQLLNKVRELQKSYRFKRKIRQDVERQLKSQMLHVPTAISNGDEANIELLEHWTEELDNFERRILQMCRSMNLGSSEKNSELEQILNDIERMSWIDNDTPSNGFSSAVYRSLSDLSDYLERLDQTIEAAQKTLSFLASKIVPESARGGVERSRQSLHEISKISGSGDSKVLTATERVHSLLNSVEAAITECAEYIEDDRDGLLATLQRERSVCGITSESLVEYLVEWKTLARKHSISPLLLPSCHAALRRELEGNVEARDVLPKAIAAEKRALNDLNDASQLLSEARSRVATELSEAVSRKLPSLGMNSRFEAKLRRRPDGDYSSVGLGLDDLDFFLFHQGASEGSVDTNGNSDRGGALDNIASSGERARILLAIVCQIPGSVRALCSGSPSTTHGDAGPPKPIAVVYDEIDAHVGGRASVELARMLSEQSASCQVLSITHSPSVAATADFHVCVQKQLTRSKEGGTVVSAARVDGASRLKELSRMAAGDMAPEEAEAFARALIREAAAARHSAS